MQASMSKRAIAIVGGFALIAPVALIPAAEAAIPRCLGRRATIVGTANRDVITGTARADVIVAKGGNDRIEGRGGNDRICSGKGGDAVLGGAGNDQVRAGGGADAVAGQAGTDRLSGQGGPDALFGGGDDDFLSLGGGSLQLAAPGAGDDDVRGGPNLDLVSYFDSATPVNVDLGTGAATGAGNDTLTTIEMAEGSPGDDTLVGSAGMNLLLGLEGEDTMESGGNTGDLLSPDTVLELRFDLLGGGPGNDTITGGTGFNLADFTLAASAVNVDLQAGLALGEGTDTLSGIQGVLGSQFDDTLRGDSGDNILEPEGGADSIDGRAGTDTLTMLDAVSGNVDLGTNSATTIYRPIDPTTGESGPAVTSTVALSDIENVWGSIRIDVIRGDSAANRFFGFFGSDQLYGLAGDDYLDGGPEFDPATTNTLDGGDGSDTCLNGTATACEAEARASSRMSARRATFRALARAISRWSFFK